MQFKLVGQSKGEKFHTYQGFSKRAGGGKLYVPVKKGVEPTPTIDVKIGS